ncbi:hypothetical protein C5N14_27140 [Micromonospora sp. MW-13]|nr:hypothetical protein C5N14_27140 [Micromonospora sp. MW-13]
MTSTSTGDRPALARACRITRCCDGPFGAVSPFDAPSWFTAEPRTTARTRRPSRRASDNRCTSSTPTPSDQPVPSAASAKDLHRPSAESPPWIENSAKVAGEAMTQTPPASARSHSPDRSAWAARCSATSEDEQAVSTVTAGPSNPNEYATRPDSTLVALPVSRCPPTSWARPTDPLAYPWKLAPAKTPTAPPLRLVGSRPADSMASQDVSSSSRCCGSIARASRGEMPKNSASNSPAS